MKELTGISWEDEAVLRQLNFYRRFESKRGVWKIKSVKFPSSVLVPPVFLLIMGVSCEVGVGSMFSLLDLRNPRQTSFY